MGYSVAAAAAAAGLSKTIVLRAIQAGRISGTKNEINEWLVDPTELHRLAELRRLYATVAGRSEVPGAAGGECIVDRPAVTWCRPSACPAWLSPTRKRSRTRGHVGGAK
jgi:hypothetical protein